MTTHGLILDVGAGIYLLIPWWHCVCVACWTLWLFQANALLTRKD